MNKKVILRRIFLEGVWRYAMFFKYDSVLITKAKNVSGVKWSHSDQCWHAAAEEHILKQILVNFKNVADVDISAIVSSHRMDEQDKAEKATSGNSYGPVQFSINEGNGRLVVKFKGRYDKEWIKELNTYGKVYYNRNKNEWFIRWSKFTVDSLSDYFSSRGINVEILKNEVSPRVRSERSDKGAEIRNRSLTKKASEAIELVRKYLNEKRYSKRTIESYTDQLDLFFKYYHDKDPADLNIDDISAFVDDFIISLGYSASYQNIIISALKMYFSLSGLRSISINEIERPRRSKALPKVFSKEEVMKIFSATRNTKHKLILLLIYSCGLRRSEVINIKLADLDRERSVINIREAKGNVDRMVPVPQKLWDKIDSYLKSYSPHKYLFEGQTGGKYSVESVYSVFKQSLKRAGLVKEVGVHCLRHSYATHLHESGLDIRYIQELLGHKSSRTTEIYTHVSRRNLFAIRSPIEDMEI